MNGEEFEGGDPECTKVVERGRVRHPEVGAAQLRRHVGSQAAEALDVGFVNDCLAPGGRRRPILTPVEGGIGNDAARHERRVVARTAARVVARWTPAMIVTIDRAGVIETAMYGVRIGIDEQFGRVEAESDFGPVGTVDPVAVRLAGRETGDIAVPDVAGPFRKEYPVGFVRIVGTGEQTELDGGGMDGVKREVDALAVPMGAEGDMRPRPGPGVPSGGTRRFWIQDTHAKPRFPQPTGRSLKRGGEGCEGDRSRSIGQVRVVR